MEAQLIRRWQGRYRHTYASHLTSPYTDLPTPLQESSPNDLLKVCQAEKHGRTLDKEGVLRIEPSLLLPEAGED